MKEGNKNMNEFIVYPKRGRMIMLAFFAFLFVLIGAVFVMVYVTEADDSLWLLTIGIISILFFGFCLIYYIKEIIVHKPILIISDEGIMDRSSYLGAGLVKWEDIRDIDFVEFGGQVFLGIFTHDPNLIIDRSSSLQRMLNQVNKKLIDSQVNIPAKNLNCPVDELIEQINSYWQKHEDHAE